MSSEAINKSDLFVTINGLRVCYDDYGSSETALIFVHGFPFNKMAWDGQIRFLKTSHRVIAYDIRGFGKSDSGDDTFSIDLFADDLIAFMDSLGIGKAIVCGLSMGGYILLNALNRYPNRFKAAILSDTQCVADTAEGKDKRFKTIAQIENGGIRDFADGFIKAIFHEETLSQKKEIVEKIRNVILSTRTSTLTNTLLALAERTETCSYLSKVKIPCLILCGEKDAVTKPEQSIALNQSISNSEFYLISNAGHMSNLEQTNSFNQHIQDFISSL